MGGRGLVYHYLVRHRVLQKIYEEIALYLDRINTAGGKGGTSTNGPQGRRFFSEELAGVIGTLAHEKQKDNLVFLHRQLSTILSIVLSSRLVDLTNYKKLCDSLTFNLCDNFPEVKLNHILHGTIQLFGTYYVE